MKLSEMINQLTEIYETKGDMNVYIHDTNAGDDYAGMSVYVYEGYETSEVNIGFNSELDIR